VLLWAPRLGIDILRQVEIEEISKFGWTSDQLVNEAKDILCAL